MLKQYSADAKVYVLINKMDIFKREFRNAEFEKRKLILESQVKTLKMNLVFKQTSIWEESL